jgi:hypothetical protein
MATERVPDRVFYIILMNIERTEHMPQSHPGHKIFVSEN